MTRFLAIAAAAAALLLAPAANAAITVLGSGNGAECYAAARDARADDLSITVCNEALRDAVMPPRDRAATFVNRGVIRLLRRNWDAALTDFDSAIRIQPAMGEAHVNRGAALIMLGRHREAITATTYGLTLNPSDPHEAYFNRAVAYEELGDLTSAYNDLRRAAELAPDWPRPQLELARFTVHSPN